MTEFVFPQDEMNATLSDKFQRVGGMELRDLFAGFASIAVLSTIAARPDTAVFQNSPSDTDLALAARFCFRWADAVLKARETK